MKDLGLFDSMHMCYQIRQLLGSLRLRLNNRPNIDAEIIIALKTLDSLTWNLKAIQGRIRDDIDSESEPLLKEKFELDKDGIANPKYHITC